MKRKLLLVIVSLFVIEGWAQSTLRLGINFPMLNPETTNIPTYMNLVNESKTQIARQLTFGDVIWKNVEPTNNSWNFVFSDSVFMDYSNLDYIANLYCMSMKDTLGYQVPWKACTDAENPACRWIAARDSNDTKQYLDTIVKRYGNVIKYWEIGNEVENHTYPASFPLAQFVQFFRYNYRWIKSSDANAKVVIPSFIGTYGVPLQSKYDWLRNFFNLGGGSYIDIIAYHDYNSWWTLPLHIDSIISIRNSFGFQAKPIWLTESSVSSNNTTPITPPYSSIDEQAADVWRRSCLAWSKGIDLHIWHSLWSSAPPSEWQEFGIIDNHGKKKKSFHSYKLLSEKIIEFTSANLISSGIISDDNENGGNGVWVVKFVVNGHNKWVMWSPDNLTYSLTPNVNTKYRIQHVVPASLSANGETAFFTKDSVEILSGGTKVFNLTSLPILVEEDISYNIEEQMLSTFFEISPNPANDYIEIKNHSSESMKINILDMSGKIIHFDVLQAKEIKKISSKEWMDGLYLYEINNKTYSGKIILQH
ncbi:MAG: T9SS type A sorting domain-containing protein [Bacteroidetes bacterium]|nr:T9SS type A sorting domain-containing protein [Bacteroidota bacterium]